MTEAAQQKYSAVVVDDEVDQVLQQLAESVDFTGQKQMLDLAQARRRKIIKETQFLQQKIEKKKTELFEEWSGQFFHVFETSFGKFKNALIQLKLNNQQVQKLSELMENSFRNMELRLNQIRK